MSSNLPRDFDKAWLELCSSVVSPGCTNWFDVAARCYVMLGEVFADESHLVSQYFSSPAEILSSGEANPNFARLERLVTDVRDLACRRWVDFGGRNDAAVRGELFDLLYSFPLIRWGELEKNMRTPLFAVIHGIDLICSENPLVEITKERGPVNKDLRDKVGLYLKAPDAMIERILAEVGISRIPESRMNRCFSAIQFYPASQTGYSLPKVVSVNMPSGFVDSGERRSVRIGIVPFDGGQVIGFEGGNTPASFRGGDGSTFCVEYSDGYSTRYQESIACVLSQAIREECDILVFPEFVMSRQLQEVLSHELRGCKDNRTLALVVAGSGWDKSNNICRLYDCDGNEVGTYHKRFPYLEVPRPESDGGQGKRLELAAEKLTEGLANPGATCSIVDVKGLGRVLPSICKDFVTTRDQATLSLVLDFEPQLICCVAASASLRRGFDAPVASAVKRGLAIACVNDLCGFRSEYNGAPTDIGIVSAPGFVRRPNSDELLPGDVHEERISVERAPSCQSTCSAAGSCLYVATIDYDAARGGASYLLSEEDAPLYLPAAEVDVFPHVSVVGPFAR